MDGCLSITNNTNKIRTSIGVALHSFDFKTDRPRTHQQDGSTILIAKRSQQPQQLQQQASYFSSDESMSCSLFSSDFRNFVGSIESSQNDR